MKTNYIQTTKKHTDYKQIL